MPQTPVLTSSTHAARKPSRSKTRTRVFFAQILADAEAAADSLLLRSILHGINLCYCPKPFRGIEERLHLWVGHRYHELPTRSYVANQSIPVSGFEIVVPCLPTRLRGALEYQPDHFLLRYRATNGRTVSLRVDYPLFATLSQLKSGLPRHLLPDRDINRLDAFLEQLQTLRRAAGAGVRRVQHGTPHGYAHPTLGRWYALHRSEAP